MLKLLPPATPDLTLIQVPFGSLSLVMDVAIDHIQFLHKQGHTEFGLWCWPFKLNGGWAAAVGPCDLTKFDRSVD